MRNGFTFFLSVSYANPKNDRGGRCCERVHRTEDAAARCGSQALRRYLPNGNESRRPVPLTVLGRVRPVSAVSAPEKAGEPTGERYAARTVALETPDGTEKLSASL